MTVTRLALLHVVSKLAEAAIRKAAGLDYNLADLPLSLKDVAESIVSIVAEQVAVDDGITLRCRLCGKGPFTRKGLYLHLKRVHIDTVQELVRRELEEYLWRARNS